MDIFTPIKCIEPKTQKDIDDSIAKYPDFHWFFVCIANKREIRDRINTIWENVSNYCEPNFLREFVEIDKFFSKLWELTLRHIFLDSILRAPKEGEPDIITDSMVIECVAPKTNGIPETRYDGVPYSYPSEEIARRITNSIDAKIQQLDRWRSSEGSLIDYSSVPYIMAIGLLDPEFKRAKGMSGLSIVEEMLIGAGPIQVTIDSNSRVINSGVSTRFTMQTINGSDYDVAYFQRPENSKISAVIWSTEYLAEARDIYIFLNPNADIPINVDSLPIGINIITYSKTEIGYSRDQPLG